VALGLAIALFVFAIPSISQRNQNTVRLGADNFAAGSAKDRARDIASGGPILEPDQSGGQRDIFLQHLGSSVGQGWYAFDARRAGQSRKCTLRWNQSARHFDDPCGGPPVSADGQGLVHYKVTVTKDGDVFVDLNPNDETGGSHQGGTTTVPASTTTTVRITGSLPPKG
jgi:hypothetical protein